MGSLITESRDATGLYYRRNRFYDSETGQFTQEDPIGIAGGLNVYGFANGDPVSYGDPYGLCAKDKKGVEDPNCRKVIAALRAAAADANVRRGRPNLFADAADAYEATDKPVRFVGAIHPDLNERRRNNDGDPTTYNMGRYMPNRLLGFGAPGPILIGNFLGEGDMVMTAAHEMLGHDPQEGVYTDVSDRIDDINDELWEQLPSRLRPSAELWRRKLQ